MSDRPFRRKVFFLSGFHDFGFRYFYPFIKRGIRQMERHEGRTIELTGPEGDTGFETLRMVCDGPEGKCETDYRYLGWNDIAAKRLQYPGALKALMSPRLLYIALFDGPFKELKRLHRPFWLAALMTTIFMSLLVFGLGGLLGWAGYAWQGWVGMLIGIPAGMMLGGWISDMLDSKFRHRLIEEIWEVGVDWANGRTPAIDGAMNEFSTVLLDALRDDTLDEVLVVGHSWGSIMSTQVVDRALARLGDEKMGVSRLSLLNLGAVHVLPCSAKPETLHHKTLARLATEDRINWVEIFSPSDPLNVPFLNPATTLAGVEDAKWPQMRSLMISHRIDPDRYAALKKDFWEMHFNYLKEADRPVHFSFLRCMTAARPLIENYRENVGGIKPARHKAA